MNDVPTLVIYMVEEDGEWIRVHSGEGNRDRFTRIIQDSYDWRSDRAVSVGERLTTRQYVDSATRRIVPSDWVVTAVESYEPVPGGSQFANVQIAYCQYLPLSSEEIEHQSVSTEVRTPVSV